MIEVLMLTCSTRKCQTRVAHCLIKSGLCVGSLTLSLRAPELLLEAESPILGSHVCAVI